MTTTTTARRPARPAVRKPFRILVASDGSPQARQAVEAAVAFPWPANAKATAVVARAGAPAQWSPPLALQMDAVVREVAEETKRTLRLRWRDATAVVVDDPAVDAIVKHARGCHVVVLGSHGYGRLERWMLGSVSRAVVRRANKTVLVVKGRGKPYRELLLGFDGSNHARRAVAMVASLSVPRRGRVTLLTFVEPVEAQPPALLSGQLRKAYLGEVEALLQRRTTKARGALERAARPLIAAGWRVRYEVRPGVAARDLVPAAAALGSDVLVVGAQGAGWQRLLLGSVVEAVLDRIPISTLVVR